MSMRAILAACFMLLQLTGFTTSRADSDADKAAILSFLTGLQDAGHADLVPIREGDDLTTTYSNAMAVIALLAHGEYDRARRILDVFAQQTDVCPGTCTCQGGFQQFRQLSTGGPVVDAGANDFWIGDNAWLLIAARRYQEATGDSQFSASLIERLRNWFICLQENTPPPGIYAGYQEDGELISSVDGEPIKHPEGSIDVYGALHRLGGEATRDSIRAWIDQQVWPPEDDCFAIGPANGAPGPTHLPLDNVTWGFLSLGAGHACLLDHARTLHQRTLDPYLIEAFDRGLDGRWFTDRSDPSVTVDLDRVPQAQDHVMEVSYSIDPNQWFRVFRSQDVHLAVSDQFRYAFWVRGNTSGSLLEVKLNDQDGKTFIATLPLDFGDWRRIELAHHEFGIFNPNDPPAGPLSEITLIEFATNNNTAAAIDETLLFGPIEYVDPGRPELLPTDGFAAFESEQNHLWVEGTGQMATALCAAGELAERSHYLTEMARHLTAPPSIPGLGLPSFLTGSTNQQIPESVASSWHLIAASCLDPFADRAGDSDGDGIGNPIDACLGDDGAGDHDGDGVCADLDCDDGDPAVSSAADCAIPPPGFVQRQGNRLVRHGEPFTIRGANYFPKDYAWRFWQSYGMAGVSAQVDRELDELERIGVNTLRIFVPFGTFDGTDPGAAGHLLDFLNRLRHRDLLAIVTLFDFAQPYSAAMDAANFQHIAEVVGPLADDPVVLAWDVKNEIDCDYDPFGANVVKGWLGRMSAEIRRLDPHHLLTVGFLGVRTGDTLCHEEPVTGPPVFDPAIVAEFAPLVDLVSFHYFTSEWTYEADLAALRQAVEAAGDKPILLEEFGLYTLSEPTVPCAPGQTTACIVPHGEADQEAYVNALLAASGADGVAGTMFWTLMDFSYVDSNLPESNHCFGILRNRLVDFCEAGPSTDYGHKPAAEVVRRHYGRGDARYLDLMNGLVDTRRDTPPAGWREDGGVTVRGHDPLRPTRLHWSRQPGQVSFSKSVPLDSAPGRALSPVLREVDVSRFPFLVARLGAYHLHDAGAGSDSILEIGVRTVGGQRIALTTVTPGDSFPLDVRIDLRQPPANWSGIRDVEIVFDLVPETPMTDGFSASYELDCIAVAGSPSVTPCAPPPPLTLRGGRFDLEVDWQTSSRAGVGQAVGLSDDTGYFWFSTPENAEILVKVLDACGLAGFNNFWAFSTALSNLEYQMRVTDTQTGQRYTLSNPPNFTGPPVLSTRTLFRECGAGDGAGLPVFQQVDTDAQPSPPPPEILETQDDDLIGVCVAGPEAVCLTGDRFRVSATWRDREGNSRPARMFALAADSGYATYVTASNVELFFKVLDACQLPGFHRFWPFVTGLTNVEVELEIVDTFSGKLYQVRNLPGAIFPTDLNTGSFFDDCSLAPP